MSRLIRKIVLHGCQGADSDINVSAMRASVDPPLARCADVSEVQIGALGRATATTEDVTGPHELIRKVETGGFVFLTGDQNLPSTEPRGVPIVRRCSLSTINDPKPGRVVRLGA